MTGDGSPTAGGPPGAAAGITDPIDGRPPIAAPLLAWYDRHGRRGLPWHGGDAYRTWVSEVMLQQTRVQTVIPYFERFMARFPEVAALAAAEIDEVLHHWSGLGYYSRARHLHRAARLIVERHRGMLPATIEQLTDLPGIGRSTAAAILAFSSGRRHAILDGNVRRVLCRYHAVDGDPGSGAVQGRLWALAEAHTPEVRVADYTQAIMDLGATVCVRARPLCDACPLASGCAARGDRTTARYPARRARRRRAGESVTMLMIVDNRRGVLLERRPPAGIWGGLWSFPQCPPDADVVAWCRERLGLAVAVQAPWAPMRHGFTHFDLEITPQPARWRADLAAIADAGERRWLRRPLAAGLGLAAPVSRILERLELET